MTPEARAEAPPRRGGFHEITPRTSPAPLARDVRVDASVIVYRLHEVGYEVDLARATQCLASSGPERKGPGRTEAQAIRIANPPVTVVLPAERVTLGGLDLEAQVSARVFDFGVASLRMQLVLPRDLAWDVFGEFARRVDLVKESRPVLDRALAALTERLAPAVIRPGLAPVHEDYVVFRVDAIRDRDGALAPTGCLRDEDLVPILLGEEKPLSEDARRELLPHRFSYYADDLAILTWNGALVIEPDREDADVQYVLEFANAQLLELRVYDELLDRELPKLYSGIALARTRSALLGRRFGQVLNQLQTLVADTAEFVERVENALKVTDDVYLARIYSSALEIFRSRVWRAGIDRKLGILRDTYRMLSDESQVARAEALELAIVVLIVVEIVLGLMRR